MSRQSNPNNTRSEMLKMDRMAEDTESERKAKELLRIEARKIRTKELEKQRRDDDNDSDSVTGITKYNHSNSSKYSSRNSSVEPSLASSRTMDARELKALLFQQEDKLKNAMVVNAQLDSEKQLLRYEVDLLKDKLEDLIDSNHSLSKLSTERKKEISYQKMQIIEQGRRLEISRQQIEARDQLMTEKGFILFGAPDENDDTDLPDPSNQRVAEAAKQAGLINGNSSPLVCNGSPPRQTKIPGMAMVSQELADALYQVPGTDLESRLSFLLKERSEFSKRQVQLEVQLEEQRERADIAAKYDRSRSRAGLQDPEDLKLLQAARAQAQEYKFKLQESMQKISALEGDIIRLEGQVKRNKIIADTCEAQENELKQEKRKLQRDMREMASQIEDLKSENATLQKRLEKLARTPPAGATSLRTMREGSQLR